MLKAFPTKHFGGRGGTEFDVQFVKEIGLRAGHYVDQIVINKIVSSAESVG